MSRKFALIIGNSVYEDSSLARLATPDADVGALTEVLQNPEIGDFDKVTPLVNQTFAAVRKAVARFFAKMKREDLLLLYFSGHGVRDDFGDLFFAVKDTERDLLSATAIPANFITGEMDRSRSRRQLLILDCCHSGAFERGSKGVIGGSVGTATAFEGIGYGRVVLTASDATQYAWEGDKVIGEAEGSVFTHYLIQGLQTGEADADADGQITVDELYDYVYEHVVDATPKQTPGKWSYQQQGEMVIARNPVPIVKPVELPVELQESIDDSRPWVREGAVSELEHLLHEGHAEMALVAHAALQRLTGDDSRRVAAAADESLALYKKGQHSSGDETEGAQGDGSAETTSQALPSDSAEAVGSLIVREGAQIGQVFSVKSGINIIGRDDGLAISIQDTLVSRRHTHIFAQAGKFALKDLDSTNGTFVNGKKITEPYSLKDGDLINVGQTQFVFRSMPEDELSVKNEIEPGKTAVMGAGIDIVRKIPEMVEAERREAQKIEHIPEEIADTDQPAREKSKAEHIAAEKTIHLKGGQVSTDEVVSPPSPGKFRGRIPVWGWIIGGIFSVSMCLIAANSAIHGVQTRATQIAITAQAQNTATVQAQNTATAQARQAATAQALITAIQAQRTTTAQAMNTATAQAQRTDAVHTLRTDAAHALETATARSQMTTTAQARKTATVQAKKTVTAKALKTATAQARMTATAEADPLVFGPGNGSLDHRVDDTIRTSRADVDLRDFVVEALFYNPYSTTKGSWDCGFLFRYDGSYDQFRLRIHSEGGWNLVERRGNEPNYIDSGSISNLNVNTGGSNRLKLVVVGDQGVFYVNDIFITALDLSSRTNSGDIKIATGIYNGYAIDGEVTKYENFTIWALRPISDPRSGSLDHEDDGTIKTRSANVDLRDFVVEALFYNPYSTTRGSWDYGFLFRHDGSNNQFRLRIQFDGSWNLIDRQGDDSNNIDGGSISNLNVNTDGSNRLKLVVVGDQGVFYVNDTFITALDLSSRTNSGDIMIATGLNKGYEIDGEVTSFEDFTIWTIP